jgi:hypothetical protein
MCGTKHQSNADFEKIRERKKKRAFEPKKRDFWRVNDRSLKELDQRALSGAQGKP